MEIGHGIKKINFGFTHIHWCVLALCTQYFPELCGEKTSWTVFPLLNLAQVCPKAHWITLPPNKNTHTLVYIWASILQKWPDTSGQIGPFFFFFFFFMALVIRKTSSWMSTTPGHNCANLYTVLFFFLLLNLSSMDCFVCLQNFSTLFLLPIKWDPPIDKF